MSTSHPMFTDEMKEIIDSFIVETTEIFEKLDNDLLQLEKDASDKDLVNRIFRAVHTVKGTAGFLSFDQMSILAHKFEDVLNKLRRGELQFQPAMMDAMFEAFDLMKILLKQVVDRRLEEINLTQTISKLESISRGEILSIEANNSDPGKDSKGTSLSSINDGETITQETLREDDTQQKVHQASNSASNASKGKSDKITESTIRVDITRLDHLMNLVGELVLGRNRLTQIASTLSEEDKNDEFIRQLTETSTQIDFITTELQTAVMKTRMVPIGKVFNKFPRLVRDLSKEFSKEIELIIVGQETELDKSVIEEISDPLVHLIRNAVDHGIEKPEERLQIGKPAKGSVTLAARHEGNHIIIEVQDDGRGLDPDTLKQKALEKGLISESEAREMKVEDCHNLIFLPGFSTAQKVTNVSGRGVGMDVVKTNITRLNGIIEVDSSVGRGTKFTLKLPLTLAIIQGLLVDVGQETFAIPLNSVVEVVRTSHEEILTVHGKEVIRLRERILPLLKISEILNVSSFNEHETKNFYTVVVAIANKQFGIVVDKLVGQKEIVIKPLGTYLKNIPGIAGSTILGDGRVIMILDTGELLRFVQADKKNKPDFHARSEPASIKIEA